MSYPSPQPYADHPVPPGTATATPKRPYSPWRSAVLAALGGAGLAALFGIPLLLVATATGSLDTALDAADGRGSTSATLLMVVLAGLVKVTVTVLQGRYLAGRGAARPYVAAFAGLATTSVIGLVMGAAGLDGVPLVAVPAFVVVVALVSTPRHGTAPLDRVAPA